MSQSNIAPSFTAITPLAGPAPIANMGMQQDVAQETGVTKQTDITQQTPVAGTTPIANMEMQQADVTQDVSATKKTDITEQTYFAEIAPIANMGMQQASDTQETSVTKKTGVTKTADITQQTPFAETAPIANMGMQQASVTQDTSITKKTNITQQTDTTQQAPVAGTAPTANMDMQQKRIAQETNVNKQAHIAQQTGSSVTHTGLAAVISPGLAVPAAEPAVAPTPPLPSVRALRRSTRPPPGFETFTPPVLAMPNAIPAELLAATAGGQPANHAGSRAVKVAKNLATGEKLASIPAEHSTSVPAETFKAGSVGGIGAMSTRKIATKPTPGPAPKPARGHATKTTPGPATKPTPGPAPKPARGHATKTTPGPATKPTPGPAIKPTPVPATKPIPGPGEVACLLCSQPFQLPTTPGRPFKYCESCRRTRKRKGTHLDTTTPMVETSTTSNTVSTATTTAITTAITTATDTTSTAETPEAPVTADTELTTTTRRETIYCRTCKRTRPKPEAGPRPPPKGVGISCDSCRERRRHYYEKSKKHGGEKRSATCGISKSGRKKRRARKTKRDTSSELDDFEDDGDAPASPGIMWNFEDEDGEESLHGDEMQLDEADTEEASLQEMEVQKESGENSKSKGKGKERVADAEPERQREITQEPQEDIDMEDLEDTEEENMEIEEHGGQYHVQNPIQNVPQQEVQEKSQQGARQEDEDIQEDENPADDEEEIQEDFPVNKQDKGKGKENIDPKDKGKKPESKHRNGWTEDKAAIIPPLITDPRELAEFRARMRTDDQPVPVINGVAQYRPLGMIIPPEEPQYRPNTYAGGASISYNADPTPFTAAHASTTTLPQAGQSTGAGTGQPVIKKIILSLNKAGASGKKGATSALTKVSAKKGSSSSVKETVATGTRQSTRLSTRNSNRVTKPSSKPAERRKSPAFRRPSKTPPTAALVSPEARDLAEQQQILNEGAKSRILETWYDEQERGVVEFTTREKLIQEFLEILDDNNEALSLFTDSEPALQARQRNDKRRLDMLERYFADQVSGRAPRLTRAEIVRMIADALRCNSQFFEMVVFMVDDY